MGRTDLFDALLVLDEQLNSGNVDVEPWPLRGPFDWGVNAAIVLAAGAEKRHTSVNADLCSHSQKQVQVHRSRKLVLPLT